MKITKFIENHFNGNKSEFARANSIPRQRVNDWINQGYIIVGGMLFSPRDRKIKSKPLKRNQSSEGK